MATTYLEPPKFEVENLIAEGDFATAVPFDASFLGESGGEPHLSSPLSK